MKELFIHKLSTAATSQYVKCFHWPSGGRITMKMAKPDPAEIEFKNMRFLITDRPTDSTIDRYIKVSSCVVIVVLKFSVIFSAAKE